jgi:hypothetical protein
MAAHDAGSEGGQLEETDSRAVDRRDPGGAAREKDGDEYILTEAWMGGGTGRELLRPRSDRERRVSYSALSATAGSTRVARRAGSSQAIPHTASRITGTATNVAGSVVPTP